MEARTDQYLTAGQKDIQIGTELLNIVTPVVDDLCVVIYKRDGCKLF
jgi:hypothetical protein